MLGGDVFITVHGARRARARLGLKRRAVPRAAETAWLDGTTVRDDRLGARPGAIAKAWRGAIWIFSEGPGGPSLMTVMVPTNDAEERLSWRMHVAAQEQRAQRRRRIKQCKRRA